MFYDNLKKICDEKGLKMTPIVLECGGSKGSITNWKKGVSPNSDIVAKLAKKLNVSTDLLILGEEINPKKVKEENSLSAGNISNSNVVSGHNNNIGAYSLSEDALEFDKILKELSPKERASFLYRVYSLAEECKKKE